MPFYDIFSKKSAPAMEKNKITIVADHREKNASVISELIKRNVNVKIEHLSVADYLVNGWAIERKTLSDLKSSIINKRILSQLPELKQYPKHILLIEGIQEEGLYKEIIHENAFRGFLLSLVIEYNVPFIFTLNAEDTAKYLIVLAKKQSGGEISLRPKKIAKTKEEKIKFILEGFPNIGPINSKKLLAIFGSLKKIINASESALTKIVGIKAKEIKSLIDYKFRKQLNSAKSK